MIEPRKCLHERSAFLVRLLLGIVLPLLGLLSFVVAGSSIYYHQTPWAKYPNPLHWCGRNWIPSGSQATAEIDAQFTAFQYAGDLPGWLNHGDVWTAQARGASTFLASCNATTVFVRIGNGRYEAMSLSGGP